MSARAALCAALLALGCGRTAPSTPAPTAVDAPAAQGPATPPADVPAPAPAQRTVRAAVQAASADPPLRALDPTMAVPPWSAEGTLELTLPSGDGPVRGALRAGDLALRVRGFRSGETVRATLEPESVDVDGGATVWRGTLECTLRGDALRGNFSLSAEAGRLARTGTVGAR